MSVFNLSLYLLLSLIIGFYFFLILILISINFISERRYGSYVTVSFSLNLIMWVWGDIFPFLWMIFLRWDGTKGSSFDASFTYVALLPIDLLTASTNESTLTFFSLRLVICIYVKSSSRFDGFLSEKHHQTSHLWFSLQSKFENCILCKPLTSLNNLEMFIYQPWK